MHNGLFFPISYLNISDYRLQPRLFMGWKDVSNFCTDCTFQVPGLWIC